MSSSCTQCGISSEKSYRITVDEVISHLVRPAPLTNRLTEAFRAFDRLTPKKKDLFLKARTK